MMSIDEKELANRPNTAQAPTNGTGSQAIPPEITLQDEEVTITLPSPALSSSLFLNRELSLLEFHARVLEEAMDPRNPLLERLKFLTIFSNPNIDEFFMIRVSGIREQVKSGVSEKSIDGMTPTEEMTAIRRRITKLLEMQSTFFRDVLRPELANEGINIVDYADLTPEQQQEARSYFDRMVFPVSTPLAVDPGHPFPHISSLSLNLAVELQDPRGIKRFARVKVPNVLPRMVPLSPGKVAEAKGKRSQHKETRDTVVYTWLEQILAANLEALFPDMQLVEVHPFRVIRDADLEIQELEADDLLESVEQSLFQRRFGSAVALFVNSGMPDHLRNLITENLELDSSDVYVIDGPIHLGDLSELLRLDRPDLKDATFTPRVPPVLRGPTDVFYAIQQGDILLHHPFDSFNPIVDFIRTAAVDKDVLAIK